MSVVEVGEVDRASREGESRASRKKEGEGDQQREKSEQTCQQLPPATDHHTGAYAHRRPALAAFAWRATRRECFLPGWSNQVLTRDCQSLRKWLRWRTLSVGSRGQFKLSYQCLECPRERWETDLFLPNWRSTTATATTAATTAGARQAGGRAGQRGVRVVRSYRCTHTHGSWR